MSHSLILRNITKKFEFKTIYQDVSFSFQNGCYAIVGANGAGKSVLLEMLAGIIAPDSGSITLEGIGNAASYLYKRELTYIPSAPSFFPATTGEEFLSFISSIKTRNKNDCDFTLNKLVEGFSLLPQLKVRFDQMSLGTQKKLFLSTLGMGDSKINILDEPSNALDDFSNQLLVDLIIEKSKNSIVIIASHDMQLISKINPIVISLNSLPNADFNIQREVYNEAIL